MKTTYVIAVPEEIDVDAVAADLRAMTGVRVKNVHRLTRMIVVQSAFAPQVDGCEPEEIDT